MDVKSFLVELLSALAKLDFVKDERRDEHRTSNVQHRMLNGKDEKTDL